MVSLLQERFPHMEKNRWSTKLKMSNLPVLVQDQAAILAQVAAFYWAAMPVVVAAAVEVVETRL